MIGINQHGLKLQEGGITEIAKGIIPIYGTYQDAKKFAKDPTWKNFGWMLASGIGDVLFFTGAGAGVKALRAAKAANTARKALKLKRSQKLLESQKMFRDTRLARITGESSSKEMKSALQSLIQSQNNYTWSLNKLKASERMLLGEVQKFGKSSLQDLTKDAGIQTAQVIDEAW